MPDLPQILRDAETIAVVGLSDKPSRTSYAIARYLQTAGYRVLPINPTIDEVLGETAYPDLAHLPDDVDVDIVNVFRRSEHTADVVRMTREYAESTNTEPVVWTQLGVSSEAAETLAEEANLTYVRNRCILVEHRRLPG